MTSKNIIKIENIRKPVEKEIKVFEKNFREVIISTVPMINIINKQVFDNKGKRLRPLLVYLSARLFGNINEITHRAAIFIEILHTATLIHDDIVDNADTRRGVPSINAVWKNKIAVLIGDYLLACSFIHSLKHRDYYLLHSISDPIKRMCEGELLQIEKSNQFDIDENTYLKIISDKTASLFSACTEIGSASAINDPGKIGLMKAFGENCGMAFQIKDDILDFSGRKNLIGKPVLNDVKEKKFTLPLIYALRNGEKTEQKKAMEIIRCKSSFKNINWLIDFVQKNGGIDYSIKKAEEFASKAQGCLITFPDRPAKYSLMQFARYCVDREK